VDDRLRWVEFPEFFIILHSICERLEVDGPMYSLKD